MDMVLAWSAASESSDTEPGSLALNKRQTKTPGAWLQETAIKNEVGMVNGKLGQPFTVGCPDYIS